MLKKYEFTLSKANTREFLDGLAAGRFEKWSVSLPVHVQIAQGLLRLMMNLIGFKSLNMFVRSEEKLLEGSGKNSA